VEGRQTGGTGLSRAVEGRAGVGDGPGGPPLTVYLDTSSLVKLYVEEPDSDEMQGLVGQADVVATSVLAYPEARATFARRRRERLMTAAEAKTAIRQLDADWSRLLVILLTDEIARSAGDLAGKHGIRGADAVHLASFEALLDACDDDVRFSCADVRLVRAARALG
jgi:predicted nucleic acid-binding protein